MKILIIGGTGTIGKAIIKTLSSHTLIIAGRHQGDVTLDISDEQSIKSMYEKVGAIDAVVAATGKVHFAPLTEMTSAHYQIGLQNKLMGQVNLVLLGMNYINNNGSFTLTSGILSRDPILTGSSAAMVNGGLDAFVKAAAIELPRNIRINCISPTILTESVEKLGNYFKGYESVSAHRVALAYYKSIEGAQTGQVYRVGYND